MELSKPDFCNLETIKEILVSLSSLHNISMQVIKVNKTKTEGIEYVAANVQLDKDEERSQYLQDIADWYKKYFTKKFRNVQLYNGATESDLIYFLNVTDSLIQEDYSKLQQCIAIPEHEIDIVKNKWDGTIIIGELPGRTGTYNIKLMAYKKPFTLVKHRYYVDTKYVQAGKKNTFKAFNKEALALPINFDIILIDDCLFFLNLNGEKFFSIERSFKKKCDICITEIAAANIISDSSYFNEEAKKGHNPRRFVSFNKDGLDKLQDTEVREQIAAKFDIPYVNGKFLLNDEDSCTNFIKMLCHKGMTDPFDNKAVEVSNAKKWGK